MLSIVFKLEQRERKRCAMSKTGSTNTFSPFKEWQATEHSITLTNYEWSTLIIYILMTTKYASKERSKWAQIAKRVKDKSHMKTAQSNAEAWTEMISDIEAIKLKIGASY